MHLVELPIAEKPRFRASKVEFHLPKPSYTIDTLTYLREKFPLERFSVIMGSDSFQNIRRWKNWEQLIAQYELIIYNRPGYSVEAPEGAHVRVLEAPLLDISASFIRNQIKAKKSVQYLLPDQVWKYVTEYRYYQ
jgi:nicotinate-nucleotide adenylyltransferase